jgi:hypothetical protein
VAAKRRHFWTRPLLVRSRPRSSLRSGPTPAGSVPKRRSPR